MPSDVLPDAEAQCKALAEQLKPHVHPETVFVGIHSGGAWVAERVAQLLALPTAVGSINVSFYRDDYDRIGLHPNVHPTEIPTSVDGRDVVLFDDVLESGRTVRAALNVLFDFGRPARVDFAVLADRKQRQLPFAPTWSIWTVNFPASANLVLQRSEQDLLSWSLAERGAAE